MRRRAERHRVLRAFGARALATVALGTALSIGGASEVLQHVHFLVQKDLDSVRVVRDDGRHSNVVAKFGDGFAANSLFKLSRVLPARVVSQRVALYDDKWLPATVDANFPQAKADIFHTEMARINSAIRHEFLSNALPFGDLIHEKAQKYDVDPALVAAVVETESRFHRTARSPVGAQGLMQLMPRTGRWLGATNLYDAEQNVDAGVKYLKYLQGRFDGNLKNTIAAYNAGEGNVQRYGGVPPFRETRSYVRKVMSRYQERKKQFGHVDGPAGAAATVDGALTLR
ncbi:MAG: lytic transglycosylase domain-containing protein [Acidobacteriota bacterium]|nr:lytic transglycosylase domain-containing protein [Acidobacteriota bacterium]